MKKYIVMCTWYGVEGDEYTDEYTGTEHSTREEARKELIEAKQIDIEGNTYSIREVNR